MHHSQWQRVAAFYCKIFFLWIGYCWATVAFFVKKNFLHSATTGSLDYFATRDAINRELERKFGFQVVNFEKRGFLQTATLKAPESSFIDALVVHFQMKNESAKFESARIKRLSLKNNSTTKKELTSFLKEFSTIVLQKTTCKSFMKDRAFKYPFLDYQIAKLILLFIFKDDECSRLFDKAKNKVIDLELGHVYFNWEEFSTVYCLDIDGKSYSYSLNCIPQKGFTHSYYYTNYQRISVGVYPMHSVGFLNFVEESILTCESY